MRKTVSLFWYGQLSFSGVVWFARSSYFLVSSSGIIVPTEVVTAMWQWVAVSIIYNNMYNSGWNEQCRFVTGHGNLTMCPAAKSGNQRSAISHNSVAHKWHWTRSIPISTLVVPVSVLSRVHCSYVVYRVVCLWSYSDWPL